MQTVLYTLCICLTVQIAGDERWASSARDALKEKCMEEIQRNVSLDSSLTNRIQDTVCPSDCSMHGHCVHGEGCGCVAI